MNKALKKFILVLSFCLFSLPVFSDAFYVCIGSFQKKDNARNLAYSLTSEGVPSFVLEAQTKKGLFYRVLLVESFKKAGDAVIKRNAFLKTAVARKYKITGGWICSVPTNLKNVPVIETPSKQEISKPKTEKTETKKKESEKEIKKPQNEVKVQPEPEVKQEPVVEEPIILEAPVIEEPVKQEVEEPVAVQEPVVEEPVVEVPAEVEKPVEKEELPPPVVDLDSEPSKVLSSNITVTNEKKPYSVLVSSYKEQTRAERYMRRLLKQDINAYVVKTYDEENLFTFDVHAGAFETEEETKELQKKLEEIGITDTKVSNYEEFAEKMDNYNKIVENSKISTFDGVTSIPTVFNKQVESCINLFPVNDTKQIIALSVFDYYNIRNTGGAIEQFESLDDFVVYGYRSKAAVLAMYHDDFNGKSTAVYMEYNDESLYSDIEIPEGEAAIYSSKGQTYNCILWQDGTNYKLIGRNENNSILIKITGFGCDKGEFLEFLQGSFNDTALISDPQVKRSLLLLPDDNLQVFRNFTAFMLYQVESDYAEEKGNVDWAKALVGHWQTTAYFSQSANDFTIDFFDLDYEPNAERVHKMFMRDKNQMTDENFVDPYNHATKLNHVDAWYLSGWNSNELTFRTQSYIVAINAKSLNEENLKEIAEDLKLWSNFDANAK
ncbi:MAG: SPOR domain-containing protein [Treponema sp.]|nr:SPOR domain-containing protein [Treponema sp.]